MKILRGCLRWLTAAAILMAAALLAWQCIDLWRTGMAAREAGDALASVYTAENVAARLQMASGPLGVCALLAAAAAALGAGQPERPAAMPAANRLRLMKRRVGSLPEAALREERLRLGVQGLTGCVLTVCGGFCLAELLDGARFVSWDLEKVMGELLLQLLPWLAAALLAGYAAAVVCDRSRMRECALLAGLPPAPAAEKPRKTGKGLLYVRLALLATAVVFIVLGVMNGGLLDVLVKAVNICTECIGLG